VTLKGVRTTVAKENTLLVAVTVVFLGLSFVGATYYALDRAFGEKAQIGGIPWTSFVALIVAGGIMVVHPATERMQGESTYFMKVDDVVLRYGIYKQQM
jgi:hypothetical protein